MLNFNGRIMLANAIFVNREIVAANVWNEISVWILHQHFDRHDLHRWIVGEFSFLFPLFALKQGCRWTVGYLNLGSRPLWRRRYGGRRKSFDRLRLSSGAGRYKTEKNTKSSIDERLRAHQILLSTERNGVRPTAVRGFSCARKSLCLRQPVFVGPRERSRPITRSAGSTSFGWRHSH